MWVCSSIFARGATKSINLKRIFLYTNTELPNNNAPAMRRTAKTKYADLRDNGIEAELFLLDAGAKKNDYRLFYKEVLQFDDDDGGDGGAARERYDAAVKLDDLNDIVLKREVKKRTLAKIPMQLAPNVQIGIELYSLVQEAKKPMPISIHARTNFTLKV